MNEKPTFFQRIFKPKPTETPAPPEGPSSQEAASSPEAASQGEVPSPGEVTSGELRPLHIPPHDPLLAYLTSAQGVIEVDKLNLDSPTLRALRAEGVRLALPLVSQGELIGLINLGPRMSEQEYSSDDFRLLQTLSTQASPALRIAQLAREQLLEARERERIENELRVARVIQEALLPKEIPQLDGWALAAYWQSATARLSWSSCPACSWTRHTVVKRKSCRWKNWSEYRRLLNY